MLPQPQPEPGTYCARNVEAAPIAVDSEDSTDMRVESVNSVKVTVEYNERRNNDKSEQNDPDSDLRNNNNLGVLFEPTRSKSPVTVQEWVAALPDGDNVRDVEEINPIEEPGTDCNDNLTLGAEAGGLTWPGVVAKLFFEHSNRSKSDYSATRTARVGGAVLCHSDTLSSMRSELSNRSASSMSCVLQSRQANPEQILQNLGFAGSEVLTRIPERFLKQPSQAKGISIDAFRKQQDDLLGSFESGFFGYRGLSGSLHRRPSGIVEKILNTLKEREKEMQKKNSTLPSTSPSHCSSIPSRFKRMDPDRKTFDTIVTKVVKTREKDKGKIKSFKSVAKSVLSPENRVWREEQIEANQRRATQLLIMGGKSFLVDDEGNEEEVIKIDDECHQILSPIMTKLKKQDSVQSCNSFESDWSDDEKNELERQFGGNVSKLAKNEDLIKTPIIRRNQTTTTGIMSAQPVYSRESAISLSDVASSSFDEGMETFADHCIPEEAEVVKNL